MTKKPDAPAIRFKGFSDAWEQRKLGEIGSVSMCRRIFKEQTSETGDIPFYKIGTFGADPDAFISRELFEEYKSKYPYPQKGDILISASGSIGRTVEFAGNNEYFQDSNIVWLNHDERLSNPFLKCFYSVVKWAGIEGSTIKRLYNDNILNTVICMPSVPEQKRIGLFFENLDNLITLHQRKFEKLTNVKKSMLEKMFPQNGCSYPEIRFKGFTDAWEQRKFSEITFLSGEKNRENLPLESYSITNESGFVPQDEKFENGGTMREANKRMYYIVSPNSFAYNPARINVGSIGYQNTGKNVIVSSLYEIFKTSDDVDDRLLWHWFKSPDFQKLIWQLQEGGVRLYFYYDKLCMGEVSLPSLEEQRKIGKFFDTLDNLITLHQRQPFLHSPPDISLIVQLTPPFYTFSWEQRKLTEFVEFFSGLTYTPNDVQENGTLVLRSSNVSNGEVVDADNIYVNPQVVNSENVKVGDIVVVVRNGSRSLIGKHAQIKAFMPNTVIGAFMTGIRSECPEFTNALLNTSRFEEEIAMNMGATINQITGYMFSKMEFKVPCLDEQKKIGEYFEKLDNLITLHQRKPFLMKWRTSDANRNQTNRLVL